MGAVDSSTGIRDLDGTIFDDDGSTIFTNDLSVTGGVHAGYNFQSGNRVFGIEADYSWTDAGRTRIFDGTDHLVSSDIDGFGSIRGRAGLAVDNALIYFTAGVGLVDLDLGGSDSPVQVVSFDEQIAAVVGAGAEAKLGSNLSALLEYLHYFGGSEKDICQTCTDPAHASAALQVLRVGVTYHIGDNPEPAAPNGTDPWSGFYLGVHAGAADTGTGLHDESDNIFPALETTLFTGDISAAGGVHVGYNHLIRSLLLGVEIDYSWTDAGSARNFGGNVPPDLISAKIDGFGSVRGRLGVASGNAAAYITGGIGFVDASVKGVNLVNSNAASIKDHLALVAGAGTEVKLSSSLSTRLEYLYYGFDEKSDTCAACGGQPSLADGSIHYVRVGLTYHLNDTPADEDEGNAGNWAGFYGGAHAGAAHSNTSIRDEDGRLFGDAGQTVFTPSTDPVGGVHAGYNFQWGNAVVGLEGDYTFVNAKKGGPFDGGRDFRDSEIRGFGSVRGRLGLAAGDALFYTTGGIGFIDATVSGGDANDTREIVKFRNFLALVAGGGVALKLTDNIAFRTEYLYYGFDEKSDTCLICASGPAFGGGVIHTARAGLSFLLN